MRPNSYMLSYEISNCSRMELHYKFDEDNKKLEVRVSEFQTSKVNITNLKKYTKLLGNFIDTDILFYLLTCQKAAITCSLVNSWKRWPMALSKLEMHTVELTMKRFQHFSLWKNFLIDNYLCDVLRDLVTFVQF